MSETLEKLYPKTELSQTKRDRCFKNAATPEQRKQKTDLTERIIHHGKTIKTLGRQNAGMHKKMHLKRILHAWKNAKEFLKKQ